MRRRVPAAALLLLGLASACASSASAEEKRVCEASTALFRGDLGQTERLTDELQAALAGSKSDEFESAGTDLDEAIEDGDATAAEDAIARVNDECRRLGLLDD